MNQLDLADNNLGYTHFSAQFRCNCPVYDQCNDSYLCPHGQTLTPVDTMRSPNGRPRSVYRASAATCRASPAFGVCTNDLLNGRALTVGPHDAVLRHHRT